MTQTSLLIITKDEYIDNSKPMYPNAPVDLDNTEALVLFGYRCPSIKRIMRPWTNLETGEVSDKVAELIETHITACLNKLMVEVSDRITTSDDLAEMRPAIVKDILNNFTGLSFIDIENVFTMGARNLLSTRLVVYNKQSNISIVMVYDWMREYAELRKKELQTQLRWEREQNLTNRLERKNHHKAQNREVYFRNFIESIVGQYNLYREHHNPLIPGTIIMDAGGKIYDLFQSLGLLTPFTTDKPAKFAAAKRELQKHFKQQKYKSDEMGRKEATEKLNQLEKLPDTFKEMKEKMGNKLIYFESIINEIQIKARTMVMNDFIIDCDKKDVDLSNLINTTIRKINYQIPEHENI